MNNNVRETFSETINNVGERNKKLCVIVSDISHYRLQPFAKSNPGRYFNLGVCENSIINVAAGLAHLGFIPVVHTFASFLVDRSFEQIKLSFGYQKLPVNIVVIGSGIEYSYHGVTHHSYIDGLLVKSVENSCVFNPGSTYEFDQLFQKSFNNGKINLFRATTQPHEIDLSGYEITPGKAITIREGKDLTIISTGHNLIVALKAAETLSASGVSCEIIYLHTIKPLDEESLVISLNKTRKFIVMEHQSVYGGLFSDIASLIVSAPNLKGVKGESVSLGSEFIHEYGTFEQHNERLGFSAKNLAAIYKKLQA